MSDELMKVDVLIQQINPLPVVLNENRTSLERAKNAMGQLIAEIGHGITSKELDDKAAMLLDKVELTLNNVKAKREPMTKLFDAIRTEFTGIEKELDRKNGQSLAYVIQKFRDSYAAEIIKKQREDEARILAETNIKKESDFLRAEIEKQISVLMNGFISAKKQAMINFINKITLDTAAADSEKIRNARAEMTLAEYTEVCEKVIIQALYLSTEEQNAILKEISIKLRPAAMALHLNEILAFRQEGMTMIANRVENLRKIKASQEAGNAAEVAAAQKRIEEQEKAEKLKIEEDKKQADQKAAQDAESQKAVNAAQTLFDQSTQLAEVASTTQAPKVKTSFQIEVLNQAGWMQLISFYFEKEGLKEGLEKLEKKTFSQIKTFAEKHHDKTGEKIQTASLRYTEIVKAK